MRVLPECVRIAPECTRVVPECVRVDTESLGVVPKLLCACVLGVFVVLDTIFLFKSGGVCPSSSSSWLYPAFYIIILVRFVVTSLPPSVTGGGRSLLVLSSRYTACARPRWHAQNIASLERRMWREAPLLVFNSS